MHTFNNTETGWSVRNKINNALTEFDTLAQLSVIDRDLNTPPASPVEGDRYIVGSGAIGDWAGWDLDVAARVNGAWARYQRQPGWLAWVQDEAQLLVWTGSVWARTDTPEGTASLSDFGVVSGSGVSQAQRQANLAGLIAATNFATANKIVLTGAGRIEIEGSDIESDYVNFTGSVALGQIEWGMEHYGGRFYHRGNYEITTYTAGSQVFDQLLLADNLQKGSAYIDTWAGISEIEDAWIQIHTSEDLYEYRIGNPDGGIKTKTINNVHRRDGSLWYPFRYSVDPATITSVSVKKMNKRRSTVELGAFDLSNADITDWVVRVESSRTVIKPIHFITNEGLISNKNTALLTADAGATDLLIEGVSVPYASKKAGSEAYPYTFYLRNCVNVTLDKVNSGGDGWADMAGGANCTDITFKNGKLNRIDFHEPAHHSVKAINMDIGTWGFYVTGLCDYEILDCTITLAEHLDTKEASIIRSRSDSVLGVDGKLTVRNLKIRGTDVPVKEDGTPLGFVYLFAFYGRTDIAETTSLATTSDANHTLFTEIYIDGIDNQLDIPVRMPPIFFNEAVDVNGNPIPKASTKCCRKMTVRNATGKLDFNMNDSILENTVTDQQYNFYLHLDNVSYDTFNYESTLPDRKVHVTAINLRPSEDLTIEPGFQIATPGKYDLYGGGAYRFDVIFAGGTETPAEAIITWTSGLFQDLTNSSFSNLQFSQLTNLKLIAPVFYTDSAANMLNWYRGSIQDETIYIAGTRVEEIEFAPAPTNGVYTQSKTNLDVGTKLAFEIIDPNDSSLSYIPFSYPKQAERRIIHFYDAVALAQQSAVLRRTAEAQLTLTDFGPNGAQILGRLVRRTGDGVS